MKEPKLKLSYETALGSEDLGKLREALGEIVTRRWRGKERPEHNMEIILVFEKDIPMSLVTEVAAAVMVSADGAELFPAVVFSPGFE